MAVVALTWTIAVLAESVSVGTPAKGSLREGVSFAAQGDGFASYSALGNLVGRQYVHSRVKDAMLELTIDFESVAELLVEVDRQAERHGLAVERFIVAPEFVERVLSARAAGIRRLSQRFMRTPAWVRHDEHLHIDFRLVAAAKPT